LEAGLWPEEEEPEAEWEEPPWARDNAAFLYRRRIRGRELSSPSLTHLHTHTTI